VFNAVAKVNAELVSYDAATDGCFPLITNDQEMTPQAVLAAYRYQPNLERRNHMLKGPQLVAPVFLESPHRIEALLLCRFLAMLTEALIERDVRAGLFPQFTWSAGLPSSRSWTRWARAAGITLSGSCRAPSDAVTPTSAW